MEINDFEHFFESLPKGTLLTLAGRPSMGKTTLNISCIKNLILKNKKSILFSLEMNEKLIINRLLAQFIGLNCRSISKFSSDIWEKIISAITILTNADFYIDNTQGISVEKIEEQIKKIKPDYAFIDYLQLIEINQELDIITQISNIMTNLKRIAEENEMVIIINSSLSRKPEEREDKRPLLSDFLYKIDEFSDIVMFMYRPAYYLLNESSDAELIIAKNNYGECQTINMCFNSEIPMFENKKTNNMDITNVNKEK